MSRPPRAVVFAYHNVGVRGLRVLLAHGVEVPLVVTHQNSPGETIWFGSVAQTARDYGIPVATPADPNSAAFVDRLRVLAADFLFSFYYRQMLAPMVLAAAPRGAYNLHGSLLPAYRGRVPVNWAVIRGETRTGATLHAMVDKPDAGAIVAQEAVPILPDDTAAEVFAKVTVAAEIALDRTLPALLAGTAEHRPMDLSVGSYFGGRKPQDGRIDWRQPVATIHNLVRGVAPPYPGAFTTVAGQSARVLRTRLRCDRSCRGPAPALHADDGRLYADGSDGVLEILALEVDGAPLDAASLAARWGSTARVALA